MLNFSKKKSLVHTVVDVIYVLYNIFLEMINVRTGWNEKKNRIGDVDLKVYPYNLECYAKDYCSSLKISNLDHS